MTDRDPLSLRLLRERAPEVLAACEASTSWTPHLHLLRDLLDTRPRTEKIRSAVLDAMGALPRSRDQHELAGVIERRLQYSLHRLPLVDVPCRTVVRKVIAEEICNLGGQVTHATRTPPYASTRQST